MIRSRTYGEGRAADERPAVTTIDALADGEWFTRSDNRQRRYRVRKAADHGRLLGSQFAAPSWDAWKITLRAAFGERLSPNERARFRELAERDPPKRRIKELWVGVGLRAGKDSVAAAIATYISVYGDFQSKVHLHLVNSSRPLILDHPQTLAEAVGLERRTHWGGGESIDHGPHGHDDCVNVLVGLCVLLASKRAPLNITAEMLARARERAPPRGYWPRSFVGSASDWYRK